VPLDREVARPICRRCLAIYERGRICCGEATALMTLDDRRCTLRERERLRFRYEPPLLTLEQHQERARARVQQEQEQQVRKRVQRAREKFERRRAHGCRIKQRDVDLARVAGIEINPAVLAEFQERRRRWCLRCKAKVAIEQKHCPGCHGKTAAKEPRLRLPRRSSGERKTERQRKYEAYLASPEWEAKRQLVIARDGGRCVDCDDPGTEVHHRTYRRLFHELLEDLELLCHGCHFKPEKHPWKEPDAKLKRRRRARRLVAGVV
jgi:hypothetical protein